MILSEVAAVSDAVHAGEHDGQAVFPYMRMLRGWPSESELANEKGSMAAGNSHSSAGAGTSTDYEPCVCVCVCVYGRDRLGIPYEMGRKNSKLPLGVATWEAARWATVIDKIKLLRRWHGHESQAPPTPNPMATGHLTWCRPTKLTYRYLGRYLTSGESSAGCTL